MKKKHNYTNYFIILEKRFSREHTKNPNANVRARPDVTFWAVGYHTYMQKDKLGLAQDTNGKVTNSQLDTTNESQEVSPFPAGDHKAKSDFRVWIQVRLKPVCSATVTS